MRAALVCLVLAACGDDALPAGVDAPPVDAPAPPAGAPDLRFRWVGAADAFVLAKTINVAFSDGSAIEMGHSQPNEFSWSPLQLSVAGLVPRHYNWRMAEFSPTQRIETILAIAKTGSIDTLDVDLQLHLGGSEIVISLDVLPDAYAFVTNGTTNEAIKYPPQSNDTPRAELDALVAAEGTAGRVVTAISASPTDELIRTYSFGRDGDSTAYETRVLDATPVTLIAQATALADGGYIITGFGHVGDDEMILVGTRTPGAPARTITVQRRPKVSDGDAIVAWIYQEDGDIVIHQR